MIINDNKVESVRCTLMNIALMGYMGYARVPLNKFVCFKFQNKFENKIKILKINFKIILL